MLRFVVILLVSALLISFLRMVLGIIAKGMADLFGPSTPSHEQQRAARRATEFKTGGELKRDPVCGIFVPSDTPYRKTVSGETVHFCSADCRDKHVA